MRVFWDGGLKTPSLSQKCVTDFERTKLAQNQYNHVICSNHYNWPFDKICLRLEMTIWAKKQEKRRGKYLVKWLYGH